MNDQNLGTGEIVTALSVRAGHGLTNGVFQLSRVMHNAMIHADRQSAQVREISTTALAGELFVRTCKGIGWILLQLGKGTLHIGRILVYCVWGLVVAMPKKIVAQRRMYLAEKADKQRTAALRRTESVRTGFARQNGTIQIYTNSVNFFVNQTGDDTWHSA